MCLFSPQLDGYILSRMMLDARYWMLDEEIVIGSKAVLLFIEYPASSIQYLVGESDQLCVPISS
jgi:hypothetical protein